MTTQDIATWLPRKIVETGPPLGLPEPVVLRMEPDEREALTAAWHKLPRDRQRTMTAGAMQAAYVVAMLRGFAITARLMPEQTGPRRSKLPRVCGMFHAAAGLRIRYVAFEPMRAGPRTWCRVAVDNKRARSGRVRWPGHPLHGVRVRFVLQVLTCSAEVATMLPLPVEQQRLWRGKMRRVRAAPPTPASLAGLRLMK